MSKPSLHQLNLWVSHYPRQATLPPCQPSWLRNRNSTIRTFAAEQCRPTERSVFRGLAANERFLYSFESVTDVGARGGAATGLGDRGRSYTSDGTVSRCGTVNVSHQREPINPAWSEIILGILSPSLLFLDFPLTSLRTSEILEGAKDFRRGRRG